MANLPVRASAGLPAGPRSFDEMYRQAEVLARSELVPKALQGKPESIVLVGLYGAEHGISLVTALSQVHIIDNKPSPSAQLQLGQAARLGHETRWVETSAEKAVLRARRREDRHDPQAWVTFTFTVDDARKAGLLDQYVEKWEKNDRGWSTKQTWTVGDDQGMKDLTGAPDWVGKEVAAGKVKRRDPWFKYTEDMLCARVATRAARRMFPDALLALDADPYSPDVDFDPDTGEVIGSTSDAAGPPHEHDDGGGEVNDAVVVEDLAPGPETDPTANAQPPTPGETPAARSAEPQTAERPQEWPVPHPKPGERQDVADVKWRRMTLPPDERADFDAWVRRCGIPDDINVSPGKVQALDAELDRRGATKLDRPHRADG